VELRIPDDPAYLRLARFAAADAAARAGFGIDETDDLRLAVSELCGLLTGSGAPIGLRFEVTDGSIVIAGVGAPGAALASQDGELARVLVEAVVDELRLDITDGTATFEIAKQAQQLEQSEQRKDTP
jgi:hypothetical protein